MALSPAQRRDLRLLSLFRGFSVLGDAIALITLYLRVAHHGQGWMIAALSIAAALPLVLLSPIAGYVVDRLPAKRFLATLCGFEGLVCIGIGYWHGDFATIALMALLTCSVAFSMPGYSALLPAISGADNVNLAMSTVQSVQGIANTAGPAIGGLLVGALGQSGPLFLDGASFALAGLGTLLLRTDRRPEVTETVTEHQLSAGLRLVFRDAMLRPVAVTVTVFMLCLGAVNVAEVFFITRTLQASAFAYGVTGTCFGIGTVAGALGARRLRQEARNLTRVSFACVFMIGVSIGAVGLAEHVWVVFLFLVITGLGVGVVNVSIGTLLTLRTPESLRGRVYAAAGALFTSANITSMVVGGALLSVIAPRTIFQFAGLAATLSVALVAPVALRTSRRLPLATAQGD